MILAVYFMIIADLNNNKLISTLVLVCAGEVWDKIVALAGG